MREILDSDFREWLSHPVTEAMFEVLSDEEQSLANSVSQGAFIDDPKERVYMGYCWAMRAILDTDNLREEIVVEESE